MKIHLKIKKYARIFLGGFLTAMLTLPFLAADAWAQVSQSRRSTDVQIDSTELEAFSLNKKTDKERLVFYSDQNASVDINDEGEPNLNTRF